MRKVTFAIGEYYHVYNRGTDKRNIISDQRDADRFIQGMIEFNTLEPIGSLYELSFQKNKFGDQVVKLERGKEKPLVEIICYCLNPNHYHMLVKQISENGISKLLKRLGGGYSWYYNNRHKRKGTLFQGVFKAIHVDSNEYLLHLSAYINLNDRVHQLGDQVAKLVRNSMSEYMGETKTNLCSKDIVLGQFNDKSQYKKFAVDSLKTIRARKDGLKEIETYLLE